MGDELLEKVKDLFVYRDGELYRTRAVSRNTRAGDLAGYVETQGYRCVKIDRVNHKIHRLIYLLHHGYCPDVLDHVDRNKLNNKIENLREANKSLNRANVETYSNSKTGYKGVDFRKGQGYRVRVKAQHYGYFTTAEEAAENYDIIALKIFGEFAKTNFNKENYI